VYTAVAREPKWTPFFSASWQEGNIPACGGEEYWRLVLGWHFRLRPSWPFLTGRAKLGGIMGDGRASSGGGQLAGAVRFARCHPAPSGAPFDRRRGSPCAISNAFGTAPLDFTSVHIARPTSAASPRIDCSTDRSLTFSGGPGVTISAVPNIFLIHLHSRRRRCPISSSRSTWTSRRRSRPVILNRARPLTSCTWIGRALSYSLLFSQTGLVPSQPAPRVSRLSRIIRHNGGRGRAAC